VSLTQPPTRKEREGAVAEPQLQQSLPDNRLTVTDFQELQRHQPAAATVTQKRVNQKQQKKKYRAMREQHNQSEARASFLSRALSWMWTNRAYGVVAWAFYYLWRLDSVRLAVWKRARQLQQKAMEEGIDALTSELSSTAKGLATKTASDGRLFIGYYLSLRPRTTAALAVVAVYQINKLRTWYRSTSKRDPKDRMQKYPASIEHKLVKVEPPEEQEEKKEKEKEKEVRKKEAGKTHGTAAVEIDAQQVASPRSSTTTRRSSRDGEGYVGVDLEDDAQILKRAGLKKLADVVRGKGVRFNRKTLRLLRSMRHFACIGDADSAAIYRKMKRVLFPKGTVVVKQDDPVFSGMYIVIRGRLVVYRRASNVMATTTSPNTDGAAHPTLGSRL
jgi:hypothetical protein